VVGAADAGHVRLGWGRDVGDLAPVDVVPLVRAARRRSDECLVWRAPQAGERTMNSGTGVPTIRLAPVPWLYEASLLCSRSPTRTTSYMTRPTATSVITIDIVPVSASITASASRPRMPAISQRQRLSLSTRTTRRPKPSFRKDSARSANSWSSDTAPHQPRSGDRAGDGVHSHRCSFPASLLTRKECATQRAAPGFPIAAPHATTARVGGRRSQRVPVSATSSASSRRTTRSTELPNVSSVSSGRGGTMGASPQISS